jgi:hypothetical protein
MEKKKEGREGGRKGRKKEEGRKEGDNKKAKKLDILHTAYIWSFGKSCLMRITFRPSYVCFKNQKPI